MTKLSLIVFLLSCAAIQINAAETYYLKVGKSEKITLVKAWQYDSGTSNPAGCIKVSKAPTYAGNYYWTFTAIKPGTAEFNFKRSSWPNKQLKFVVTD